MGRTPPRTPERSDSRDYSISGEVSTSSPPDAKNPIKVRRLAGIGGVYGKAQGRSREVEDITNPDENTGDLKDAIGKFWRGIRNIETMRARLNFVAKQSDELRDALLDFACGAMDDAGGWPRKPSDLDITLVAADEHSILARVARSSDVAYVHLLRHAENIQTAISERRALIREYRSRQAQMEKVTAKLEKAKNQHSMDFEVAVAGTEYVRAAEAVFQATQRLEAALVAFDNAIEAEEAATKLALAAARVAHAERASGCLRPVVDAGLRSYSDDEDAIGLARLLDRNITTNQDIAKGMVLPQTRQLIAKVLDLQRNAVAPQSFHTPGQDDDQSHFENGGHYNEEQHFEDKEEYNHQVPILERRHSSTSAFLEQALTPNKDDIDHVYSDDEANDREPITPLTHSAAPNFIITPSETLENNNYSPNTQEASAESSPQQLDTEEGEESGYAFQSPHTNYQTEEEYNGHYIPPPSPSVEQNEANLVQQDEAHVGEKESLDTQEDEDGQHEPSATIHDDFQNLDESSSDGRLDDNSIDDESDESLSPEEPPNETNITFDFGDQVEHDQNASGVEETKDESQLSALSTLASAQGRDWHSVVQKPGWSGVEQSSDHQEIGDDDEWEDEEDVSDDEFGDEESIKHATIAENEKEEEDCLDNDNEEDDVWEDASEDDDDEVVPAYHPPSTAR
uniref:BAR domain-containing protein n=1 Tax=Aureoumbra lagunensis TaxID=44058 RepID=A0A7S3K087_9STRA|mmetsp:Transcript_20847/g.27013  ORF Transcript_20847/g.27013 Transcript_20847/m.27013 type:complete len:683 (-) Transcript_20847:65-2113(-)